MFSINNEGVPDDLQYNWDEDGNPPSQVFLEDAKGQCIAQVLCSNEEEQQKYTRLLAASTDMKTLLTELSTAQNKDTIINTKVIPLLNFITGVSNE